MSDTAKYTLFSILHYVLAFGGTGAVVIINAIAPNNPVGFKITFTGIVLIVMLIMVAKAKFEKNFANKMADLQQLHNKATSDEERVQVQEKIDTYRKRNKVYQEITTILPILVALLLTYLGRVYLSNLTGTLGLILTSVGGGQIFDYLAFLKKDSAGLEKIKKGK